MSKNVYIRCPRCELNFILKKEKYCPVCKQEMQTLSTNFVDENNSELGLCPICKVNYIMEEETVCSTCMSESDLTEDELDALYGGVVVEKAEDIKDDELTDDDEDLEMVSLGEIEGEEEDAADEDDEEQSADPLDDFDDSLDDDDDEDEDDDNDEDFDKYEE